jgi:UDP-3-O-[3-hydroxymyristoyl] glucosamine N-acyltransferase
MSEPIFFKPVAGLTVSEIAALTGAEPQRSAALERRIANVAALDRAGPGDLVFLDKAPLVNDLAATQAGACLTSDQFVAHAPSHVAVLRTREPYRAFVAVARALFPAAERPSSLFEIAGVSSRALVDPSARIENRVTIDPGASVGPRAEIGAGTMIAAGAIIGAGVRIGRDCAIGAGASITHALIGDRVIIHPGCRIGQDGYAYLRTREGHQKIPQLGRVIIQDDVEIGANSTVDRGGIRDTMIGEGTKIDNLVQIGHNAVIGRHCLLVSQVGVSGSVTIGDQAMLGGQVGVADHCIIGERAQIMAKSGVICDVPPGEQWGGYPARPRREFLKAHARLLQLVRTGRAPRDRAKEDK